MVLFFQSDLSLRLLLDVNPSEFFYRLFLLDILEYSSAYNKGDIYCYVKLMLMQWSN